MATVKFSRRTAPAKLFDEQLAKIDALTAAEIERNAIADIDNPPMSDDELKRAQHARMVRRVRQLTGLSQAKFAARFCINSNRLKDWEQGRSSPDSMAIAFLRVIEKMPKEVEKVLAA